MVLGKIIERRVEIIGHGDKSYGTAGLTLLACGFFQSGSNRGNSGDGKMVARQDNFLLCV